jgi:hypothetical protein
MGHLSDQEAATAIRAHHDQLAGEIRNRVTALGDAVAAGLPHEDAWRSVVEYLDGELLPHAHAEEEALYPAGDREPTALLVRSMRDEHRTIVAHVERLRAAEGGMDAAVTAAVVLALFESHLVKENDLLVPALAVDPGVDLAALLEGMHELVG